MIAGYLWMYRPPFVRVRVATPPQWANTDHDLFDIVLSDLIENEEFNPATGGRGVQKHQIVVGNTSGTGFNRLPWDFDKWLREKEIPPEIKADLLSRNSKHRKYFLARYRPSNPNILVARSEPNRP